MWYAKNPGYGADGFDRDRGQGRKNNDEHYPRDRSAHCDRPVFKGVRRWGGGSGDRIIISSPTLIMLAPRLDPQGIAVDNLAACLIMRPD